MNVLDRIVATKREEVAALRPAAARLRAEAEAAPAPRAFEAALRRGGEVALIAEVKRRSPSAGWIRREVDAGGLARAYAEAGAAAVSVLTDGAYFGGTLADLRAASAAVSVPVLRKDFVVDAVQLWEARAAGADAVLLIARLLDDGELAELHAGARELGMGVLVEAHTAEEVDRAVRVGATVVGVNARDLSSFRTDLDVVLRLAERIPADRVRVGESGVRTPEDVDRLGAAGLDAVLVGESLMRSPEPGAAAARLAGRRRAAEARAR